MTMGQCLFQDQDSNLACIEPGDSGLAQLQHVNMHWAPDMCCSISPKAKVSDTAVGGACPAPTWGRGSPSMCWTPAFAHHTRSSRGAALASRPEHDTGAYKFASATPAPQIWMRQTKF